MKKAESARRSSRSIDREVKDLLEMFEFFLAERQLGKPIGDLGDIVKDLRILIGRILIDHFLDMPPKDGSRFLKSLAAMLADRAASIEGEGDGRYVDYCIGEILTPFEYAAEIKSSYGDDPVMQKILALDIPILRPFDYGMRGRLKLVPLRKRKVRHG